MISKYLKPVFIGLLVQLCCCSAVFAQPTFNNVTILVSSCDKYAPLWDPFFTSLFRHWPSLTSVNQNIPILLIANKKVFVSSRVQTINIPHEKSWSDNMLAALDQVQTQYVLLFLDDYWITKPVNEQRLLETFNVIQNEQLAMVQIAYNDTKFHSGPKHSTLTNALYTDKYARYKASLQLAIWDKEALRALLKPGENPWQFEIAGTARSHGYQGTFLHLTTDYPIAYLNATKQGHVEQFAVDYALQNGIKFDCGELPLMEGFNYKLAYNKWKNRALKLWDFLQEPGMYYKVETDN